MAKSHRDLMKRTLAQAVNHINAAATDISSLEDEFRPVHPNLANGLVAMLSLLAETLKLINVFAELAWQMKDPNWDAWI